VTDGHKDTRPESDAEYWGRQRLRDLMLREIDAKTGRTTQEETYSEAFERIGAKRFVDFVVKNSSTGTLRQLNARELLKKFGTRVLCAGETEQDLARRIEMGFGVKMGEDREAYRKRLRVSLGMRPIAIEGLAPDFELETHRISCGERHSDRVKVAIYRTERVIRLILIENRFFSKPKTLPIDFEFDQIIGVERERLEPYRAQEVLTLITKHEIIPSISVWDQFGTLYQNVRAALGR
jgi:hypothetical protein